MKSFGQKASGGPGGWQPFLKLGRATGNATPESMPPASAVGTLLCATRMRMGKDLQRIAEVLHIRYSYLVAIEDGRYEDLPGHAYALGFVRAYADHLGLDGDEVVRRFKEDSVGISRKTVFEFPLTTPDSGVPSGALILAAMVLGMLVYGVWYSLAGSDRNAVQVIQEVPDRLTALLNPGENGNRAPATGAQGSESGVDAPPAALDPPSREDSDQVSSPSPAAAEEGAETTASIATVAPVPDAAAGAKPVLAEENADVIDLRAKEDIWVTLRDGQKPDQTQFLRKDEVFRVAQSRGITLITGKARDLEILINGKAVPPLDEGLFARGVVLDPQRLKAAP